ncbi:hypothetical protein B0H15DRAFT_806253 [Mycena belliarum]|uniref:Uncharacterized protein n=1 Tax=Mycena belliarum TaxID=1033014 RepID=A0AAD6TPA1_9AGAR|nr:hypothetical protein B0H15DRAFT_806253 [Mycena belliae]
MAWTPPKVIPHIDYEGSESQVERNVLQAKWRARPAPAVQSYEEFLVIRRFQRDGREACSIAIASMRLATRLPAELDAWLSWHLVSNSLTAADNYGGLGRAWGTRLPGWGNPGQNWRAATAGHWGSVVGPWGGTGWGGGLGGLGGGWGGPHVPKTPQKKKKRKAALRALIAEARRLQDLEIHGSDKYCSLLE